MTDVPSSLSTTWQRFSATALRLFHAYGNWLVSISWKRFFVLSILLLILTSIVAHLPLFSWTRTESIDEPSTAIPEPPKAPQPPSSRTEPPNPPKAPAAAKRDDDEVSIKIDKDGIRITPRRAAASGAVAAAASAAASSAAAAAASGAASTASTPASGGLVIGGNRIPGVTINDDGIEVTLPGASREAIREAARAAREAARESTQQAQENADEARRDAEEARRDAEAALQEARRDLAEANREAARSARQVKRVVTVRTGDSLMDLAFFFIVASAILKFTYKGRIQAEVKAAAATETAESEQLKRQVVEARMAAMQAQVEPHFLFNTLASIDHLIETDPPRASQMQKNLIALLRASMPTMRENHPAAHNLGREMAVIRPYLEILKVRMEDRLQTEIDVPEGLMSADFPSMMIQSLVENAIKHGLEPKPEGGLLSVRAEVRHGKLAVTVADTGLGFGKAATAGTGVGLANIRERLQLLYGNKASMTVAENSPSGTVVTLTVPYQAQAREGEAA